MTKFAAGLAALTLMTAASAQTQVQAQPSAITRTTLQSHDFPGAVYRSELMRVELAKGGTVARHTHPGLELTYVQNGQALLKVAGQPDRTLKTGDSFSTTEGTPHSVTNTGPGVLTLISTYVVDKAKPLATPAP
jgi:quercetin dioxygenase-like cupin family protein